MKVGLLGVLLSFTLSGQTGYRDYFVPRDRVAGIGLARNDISKELLLARTDLMIQTQTFTILREPQAVAGARRIVGDPKLQSIIRSAAATSGFPADLIEAIAYLESWGDSKAVSPAGPRGIMQISEATARSMGLSVRKARRYRTYRQRFAVRGKKTKTVTRRIPYYVTVRDDRMNPARAIPAAAKYLSAMQMRFGGQDWSIFAYHCGQGCVASMIEITRAARGVPSDEVTVPHLFFFGSPVWNRELHEAVEEQMERDYSPTYWFRVMRARQLLALYRRSPAEFAEMAQDYRMEFDRSRAPHRLAVWLKPDDLVFKNADAIRSGIEANLLVKAFDRPEYFGYSLESLTGASRYPEATPAAIGALTYIAFETRRLHEALRPHGEVFQPLEVVSLVTPEPFSSAANREDLQHGSGQVFDIAVSNMPPGELKCLRFVLNDLGWAGYLGFIEDGSRIIHIGGAPGARDFFTRVFREAAGHEPDGLTSSGGNVVTAQ